MDLAYGSLRGAGTNGNYWSAIAYIESPYAYNLDFSRVNVTSSDADSRLYGFTVGAVFDILKLTKLKILIIL